MWPDLRARPMSPPHPMALGRGRPPSARRGARGARGRARRRGAAPGRALPDRRGRQRASRPAGLLPGDPRASSASCMDAENFYIALYDDRPQRDQLPVLRRHRRSRTSRIPTSGSRSGSASPRADGLRPAHRASRSLVSPRATGSASSRTRRDRAGRRGRPRTGSGAADRGRPRRRASSSSRATTTGRRTTRGRRATSWRSSGSTSRSALTRARAIEETRQRNAELALVNEIGQALAQQLDFDAIIELVGERVRAIFDAATMFIALYDAATDSISLPVRHRRGRALRARPIVQLGPGLTSTVIRTAPAAATRDHRGAAWRRRRSRSAARDRSPGSACRSWPATASSASIGLEASSADRLQRGRRTPAQHARVEHGRRARERPACSTRRSGCSPRPTSARPSWPSSTASSRACGRARHAGDVRARRRQDPGDLRRPGRRHRRSSTARPASSTSRTPSSAASGSPTSRCPLDRLPRAR